MSFPPRPPMGMPSMMGQGYGFPPVGMMGPMGMMPTQMMRPVSVGVTSTTATSTAAAAAKSKRLVPQEIPKDSKEDKPPVTTAFVGNISERAPDAMVRQMLQRCGNVLSWKRVQGASGKLQAFGFCEYEDPEATLRCMRLLNSWKITDKNLVVKVDAKTKTLLDDYKKKKHARENTTPEKRNGDKGENEEEETNGDAAKNDLDEFTKREDRVAKAGLDAIMREYAVELDKEPSHEPSAEEKKEKRKEQRKEKKEEVKDAGLDDMELEEGKKDLINREIQSFRDAHKGEEEKEAERNRERERRRREEERERERRERERDRERREKEREMKKDRERTRSLSRERTRSRSRDRERERHERERERELEDEEEAYERRKLEKKLREKEAGYQERLKNWEARERKKTREYEKEREKEEERKAEESREARRLKEFLEDYDDERDDPKYYKGSALQRRLKEREKEMEADARDRQREKEEIDEIRRRLLEEGHPNLEEQMAKIERERDEHLMPRLHNAVISIQTPPSSPPPAKQPQQQQQPQQSPQPQQLQQQHGIASQPQPVTSAPAGTNSKMMMPLEPSIADLPPEPQPLPENDMSPQSSPESDGCEPLPSGGGYSDDSASQPFIGPATREDQQKAKIGFSAIKLGRHSASPGETAKNKRKKLTVGDVFNQDDDDNSDGPKKRKLEKLDYSQEEAELVGTMSDMPTRPTTAEEKRKCIKMLIEKIPTAKEELFAYTLDWNMVDTTLMDRRIKPWVNKKIVEYIGEEEPTLTDFICQKVMAHSAPQVILNDVAMVLDEEAEVFVVKMWRLLIYETEAKKAGLVK